MHEDVNTVNMEAGKRSYHHGNLRQALVEAGLQLLESSGSAQLSLREVARTVGVSPTAVYRHFPEKEALLSALAADGFRRLAEEQGTAFTTGSTPMDGFNAMGRVYVRFALRNPAIFRLMFGGFIAERRDRELTDAENRLWEGLSRAVASLLPADSDGEARHVTALRAWSLVHGLSLLLLERQVKVTDDAVDTLIDRTIDGCFIEPR
jgi:AcrR family transcriptional regulator